MGPPVLQGPHARQLALGGRGVEGGAVAREHAEPGRRAQPGDGAALLAQLARSGRARAQGGGHGALGVHAVDGALPRAAEGDRPPELLRAAHVVRRARQGADARRGARDARRLEGRPRHPRAALRVLRLVHARRLLGGRRAAVPRGARRPGVGRDAVQLAAPRARHPGAPHPRRRLLVRRAQGGALPGLEAQRRALLRAAAALPQPAAARLERLRRHRRRVGPHEARRRRRAPLARRRGRRLRPQARVARRRRRAPARRRRELRRADPAAAGRPGRPVWRRQRRRRRGRRELLGRRPRAAASAPAAADGDGGLQQARPAQGRRRRLGVGARAPRARDAPPLGLVGAPRRRRRDARRLRPRDDGDGGARARQLGSPVRRTR